MATNKTVRDVALEIPGATRVFERLGIDYCCGGNQPLGEACAAAGVTLDEVQDSLTTANAKSEATDFSSLRLTDLIRHIIGVHHEFTKAEILRLWSLINKVYEVHGGNHPELARIRSLFESLSAELGPHMMKEECMLFPFIMRLEDFDEKGTDQVQAFGTVRQPIQMMMLEHESAGQLLREMRAASSNYVVPPDGCLSYQTLYGALEAFEQDLHQHIHLENNILFPRAAELESK